MPSVNKIFELFGKSIPKKKDNTKLNLQMKFADAVCHKKEFGQLKDQERIILAKEFKDDPEIKAKMSTIQQKEDDIEAQIKAKDNANDNANPNAEEIVNALKEKIIILKNELDNLLIDKKFDVEKRKADPEYADPEYREQAKSKEITAKMDSDPIVFRKRVSEIKAANSALKSPAEGTKKEAQEKLAKPEYQLNNLNDMQRKVLLEDYKHVQAVKERYDLYKRTLKCYNEVKSDPHGKQAQGYKADLEKHKNELDQALIEAAKHPKIKPKPPSKL